MATTISISNQVLRERAKVLTPTVSTTLLEGDSFQEINVGTDALVLTLPLITSSNIGLTYTFRNTGVAGNNIITIAPNAVDAIIGIVGSIRASGTINKAWINVKATSQQADFVTLKAVSVNKWYIQGGVGIFASQA